ERRRLLRTISAISRPNAGSDEAKSGMAIGSGRKFAPSTVMLSCAAALVAAAMAMPPARPSLRALRRVRRVIVNLHSCRWPAISPAHGALKASRTQRDVDVLPLIVACG